MNKKEYSIVINGLKVAVKDGTKLIEVLKQIDAQAAATASNAAAATSASSSQGAASGGGGGGGNAQASRGATQAVTDEEKALRRLEATRRRLAAVDGETNRAQIEATQALRERTREVTREIAINQLAEGSINQMGMQLTDLRNAYYDLSEAERENADIGGEMLEKIQALDAEYKALKESAGDFRDSVGNYEKALGGLEKLDQGLGQVNDNINSLSSSFAGNNAMMGIFGSITEGATAAQEQLAKIMALVTIAQQVNTAVTGENSVMKGINAAVTKVQTIQENARTIATNLSTRSTIAATAAQWLFNAAAAANPYVLLAVALVAVIAALVAFAGSTEDAAEEQKKLNEEQKIWLDYLDAEVASLQLVSDARVNALERQLKLASAQGASLKSIRSLENDIYKEKLFQNARLLGVYHKEVEALEENRAKLKVYLDMMRDLRLAEARGDSSIMLDIDLNGAAEKVDVKEAMETVQSKVDLLGKSIDVAVRLKTEQLDLLSEPAIVAAERAKADKEAAKKAAEDAKRKREEAKKLGQEIAATDLAAQRALEDLKLKLAGETLEAQRRAIRVEYERQIRDLQIRLKQEENLSKNARQAINGQIVALGKIMAKELEALGQEIAAKELETTRLRYDQERELIKGITARKLADIDSLYDRQIDDTRRRLNTEKDLTAQQREDLNALILGYDEMRERDYQALTVEGANKRASIEIQTAENTLKEVQLRVGEAVKRNEGGIFKGVLDPKQTKENLETIKQALADYQVNLEEYRTKLAIAHKETLAGMEEGSLEYKEELQKFAAANNDVTAKIKEAQKQQKDATKMNTEVMAQYYMELFGKIAEYADAGAQAITSVFDTLSMGIEASLESLNAQLETTNANYEAAKENREKYAENVEAIEEKVQNATGATAEMLRDQLQNAMHDREEAAREEQRMAKEKEKLEAEIAKKEKQMKRNELMGKIAMGVANTAQGVTSALSLGPILGIVMAAIVGAMGAAQVLIMSRQLSKLAKGGPIVGPSHTLGGVDLVINGRPTYEAEGGEFMVNKKSYAANAKLTEFINASPFALNAGDIIGNVPGFEVPAAAGDIASRADDTVVEAINEINFTPVVSVRDILDVTNDITVVTDLAGFGNSSN